MAGKEWEEDEKAFDATDRQWTASKFIGLGFATLIVAVFIIVWSSTMTGCTLAWTPLKY